jgi:hypothetical protein
LIFCGSVFLRRPGGFWSGLIDAGNQDAARVFLVEGQKNRDLLLIGYEVEAGTVRVNGRTMRLLDNAVNKKGR